MEKTEPYFTNDAIVFGMLMVILALIFYTSKLPRFKKFYTIIPAFLLCYFIPSLLNWPLNLANGENSQLYFVASRYLLPACLVLLCLSIDLKGIFKLGPKALIMFFTATTGIMLGGPFALWIVGSIAPEHVLGDGPDAIWRGLSTVAGSWIGGGANQTAMKEVYQVDDILFGSMVVIDVFVANLWMGFLLFGAGISDRVDKWFNADSSAIKDLQHRVENYQASIAKIPTSSDIIILLGVAFGAMGISHLLADIITPFMDGHAATLNNYGLNSLTSGFFWLVVISTTLGIVLSFTKLRQLEGIGASKFGTLFIFILVATIGLKMNLREMFENWAVFKYLIATGLIWMLFHVTLLLTVAKIIKAPFFFVAVGSQANVGGAASAPIVASAFSPALVPVAVLLAVLGYALGTYGAIICAELMRMIAT